MIAGSQIDWTPAGMLVVTTTGLEFRSRLAAVPEGSPEVAATGGDNPTPVGAPPTPATKTKSRNSKWD